jgi:hypothetical protein
MGLKRKREPSGGANGKFRAFTPAAENENLRPRRVRSGKRCCCRAPRRYRARSRARGRRRSGLEQPAQGLETVIGAEVEVEKHHVERFIGDSLYRPGGRGSLGGRVASGLQRDARGFADRRFVVDDKDAHGAEDRYWESKRPRTGRSRDPARSSFNEAAGGQGPRVAEKKIERPRTGSLVAPVTTIFLVSCDAGKPSKPPF